MAHVTSLAGNNIPAFLDLIAFSEGTSASRLTKNDGYDVIVTGIDGPEVFTSYASHPFVGPPVRAPKLIRLAGAHPALSSTASGRYQVLARYYNIYVAKLGLRDFSPLSQDLIAIEQIRERGALPLIVRGDIRNAITMCSTLWASLPGANTVGAYAGQNAHPVEVLLDHFAKINVSATARA